MISLKGQYKSMLMNINEDDERIKNYPGFVMQGKNMAPTINEGDHLVVDLDQRAIRSGEVYIIRYKKSQVVCRLLLDADKVRLVFDGTKYYFEEPMSEIAIIGRVIEVKQLD